MKYVAMLDSDDELSEDVINELKETAFVGDEKTPYCFEITSIKEEQEDCISRTETIKYLNTNMAWYDEDGELADDDEKLKAITDLVNGVPSEIPAPKKCHNVNKEYDDCDQFVCSNCGIELQDWLKVERDEDGDITFHGYEFKHCPNCGARVH